MHDPQYRVAIAGQSTAYNQPPHPRFPPRRRHGQPTRTGHLPALNGKAPGRRPRNPRRRPGAPHRGTPDPSRPGVPYHHRSPT
ncbi:hypothetical protein ABZ570_04765 [Micromonospora sp. NPDC007271]|uniref:rhamnogalacturonan lyase family protein n=1 Tax=Micromonospora sp. NPDC007271 TaxID=3154587 RepID=UPI0033C9D922